MFFVASKIFWFFARPLNLLLFALLAAGLLARIGRIRIAKIVACSAGLALFLIGFTQLPDWLIHRLESATETAALPDEIAGIIVLGGGLSANAQSNAVPFHLGEASDRIIAGLSLKRRYPAARLIYSGGLGSVGQIGLPETDAAKALVAALYGDEVEIELESRSRNTWQNALFAAELAGPDAGRQWLLVTSAFHMPRSIGAFRAAGMDVVPVPADFRADKIGFPFITGESSYQFLKFSLFVKELIGIAAYRATGRMK